jgi:hypothetical protein
LFTTLCAGEAECVSEMMSKRVLMSEFCACLDVDDMLLSS